MPRSLVQRTNGRFAPEAALGKLEIRLPPYPRKQTQLGNHGMSEARQQRKSAVMFDDLARQLQNSEVQTVTSAPSESRSEMIGIAASHSTPLSGCKVDTFDP
jgi:hypothetical protein